MRSEIPVEELYLEKTFQVRGYEVDPDGRAKIFTIQNYLQETAFEHANRLKVSVRDLFPKGLTWVLSRLHMKIYDYPYWHQEVRIRTWPSGREGFYATRDFEILNQVGECIGVATTSWILLDFRRRRPVAIAKHIPALPAKMKRVIEDAFPPLPEVRQTEFERHFLVRLSDLDMNQHANNVAFLDWCLEAIPLSVWNEHEIREIEMHFRAEALYGQQLHSRAQQVPGSDSLVFLHVLENVSEKKEVARARSRWQRRQRPLSRDANRMLGQTGN